MCLGLGFELIIPLAVCSLCLLSLLCALSMLFQPPRVLLLATLAAITDSPLWNQGPK